LVPGLQRACDDRQVRRVGVEVLAQPHAWHGFGLGGVPRGPFGEAHDRAGELLGLHGRESLQL
jgi:hypothetical protein